ncbi:MAG: S8 family serine peptidase [Candidatus Omnitrophota bacterium]
MKKKILMLIVFLLSFSASSVFSFDTKNLEKALGKGAQPWLNALVLNPTVFLSDYGDEIPLSLWEKIFPDLFLLGEESLETQEVEKVPLAYFGEEKIVFSLPQPSPLQSASQEEKFPLAREEKKENSFSRKKSEENNEEEILVSSSLKEVEKPSFNLKEIAFSVPVFHQVSEKIIHSDNAYAKLNIPNPTEKKILTAQETFPVYSAKNYEIKLSSIKLPEQRLPPPYTPSLPNENNFSLPTLPQTQTTNAPVAESSPLPFNFSPPSGISGLSSSPSPEPEKKEENNLPPFLISPLSAQKETRGNGIQKSSERIGKGDSFQTIRVGILDIDPIHAELVKEVLIQKILEKNPEASLEIITYILPGKKVGNGKEVSEADILKALGEIKKDGVKVLNMSIGPEDGKLSHLLVSALQDLAKDVFIVASSGNEGRAFSSWRDAGDAVLSVGACGESYANTGDTCRPAYPGLPGTSFTAPQVSAEAVLAFLKNPLLSKDELFASLKQNETPSFGEIYSSEEKILLIPGFHTYFPKDFPGFGLLSPQDPFPSFLW